MRSVFIYEIVCKVNNKRYIGQTYNLTQRKNYHKRQLHNNEHTNPWLQKDYNNYGLSQFEFNIIEKVENKDIAIKRETYWMNYYNGVDSDNIYNVKGNGRGQDNIDYVRRKTDAIKTHDNFKNHNHTIESRVKTSRSLKESYAKGLHRKTNIGKFGIENAFYGKHHTEKTKKYLSNLRSKMRKYSEDQINTWIYDFNFNKLSLEEISSIYNVKLSSLKYIIFNKEAYLKYGLNNKPSKI